VIRGVLLAISVMALTPSESRGAGQLDRVSPLVSQLGAPRANLASRAKSALGTGANVR